MEARFSVTVSCLKDVKFISRKGKLIARWGRKVMDLLRTDRQTAEVFYFGSFCFFDTRKEVDIEKRCTNTTVFYIHTNLTRWR